MKKILFYACWGFSLSFYRLRCVCRGPLRATVHGSFWPSGVHLLPWIPLQPRAPQKPRKALLSGWGVKNLIKKCQNKKSLTRASTDWIMSWHRRSVVIKIHKTHFCTNFLLTLQHWQCQTSSSFCCTFKYVKYVYFFVEIKKMYLTCFNLNLLYDRQYYLHFLSWAKNDLFIIFYVLAFFMN